MNIVIVLLSACLMYVLALIMFDLILGPAKERGFLTKFYAQLTGSLPKRKKWYERLLRLTPEQFQYNFDLKKYLTYAIPACMILFLFTLFFFRSLPFALLISFVGIFYPRIIVLGLINKRRNLLNNQLKEAMFSLSASLRAGSSLHKAIERSVTDLEQIFHQEKEAPILVEFKQLAENLRMGFTVEETLLAFKERVQLEDVDDMVNATIIAKNRGGNLTEVFANIAKTIGDKIEIRNEIQVLTAGKRMESKILSLMPIGIVGSLSLVSPQYMEPLYQSFGGRVLMLAGFVLILLNYIVSRKIIDIDV